MTELKDLAVLTGAAPAILGNAISDAINAAMRRGMAADEAVSVALQVAVDYGRHTYGESYVRKMSDAVKLMGRRPLRKDPSDV